MKIYFDDRPLQIIKAVPGLVEQLDNKEGFTIVNLPDEETVAEVVAQMQTNKELKVKIYAPDRQHMLQQIQKNFTLMQAAGGLVTTNTEKLMLIFRKGKWDLPKGKRDEGETMDQCALREVMEETAVKNLVLEKLLHVTYHTYTEKQKTILKETHWFHMTTTLQPLKAQADEGIEKCIWVDEGDLSTFTDNMHLSVQDVLIKATTAGIITAVI